MIDNTPAWHAFILACIYFLSAVVPVSIAYSVYDLCFATTWRLFFPLRIWLLAETIFYFAFQLPLLARIQNEAVHPPLRSREERRKLFARTTANFSSEDLERHLCGWFKGAQWNDIGRESVKNWLAWAYFEGRLSDDGKDAQELEEYVAGLERLLGKTFQAGNGQATPLRLTFDPIKVCRRSLLWYWCVAVVDFLTYTHLWYYGYHFHRQNLTAFFTVFPFRPWTLTTSRSSPTPHLTYWHRPHTSKTRLPVVFIHGIGIGLYPYLNFLRELNEQLNSSEDLDRHDDGQVGILAIEVMPISSRITHAALSKDVLLNELATILEHHNLDKFVLVSHSYGSVLTTHILHDTALQHKVASVLLIDPVSFLLHRPNVAYNFTVREPSLANEYQLWYFGSMDPGVAHTLGRRFFWSENLLWLEDLMPLVRRGMHVSVSLAGRDLIVDTEAVAKYLTDGADDASTERHDSARSSMEHDRVKDSESWKHASWTGRGLEVLWFDDTDHGQCFDTKQRRKRLVDVVRTYSASGLI